MAKRPIFIPSIDSLNTFVVTKYVEFKWIPGIALTQQQKNIESLHLSAKEQYNLSNILEISSKSTNPLGKSLSALNLFLDLKTMGIDSHIKTISVESAFQGSKVFFGSGPFHDLYNKKSKEAKKDLRIKKKGIIHFNFFGVIWPNKPLTLFYDWLYINALFQSINDNTLNELYMYDAFSDIAFNPNKSINCQAYSCALYVSLCKRGLINDVMNSTGLYKSIISKNLNILHKSTIKLLEGKQGKLFDSI